MHEGDLLVSSTELRKMFGNVSHMAVWRWLRLERDPLPAPAAIISRRFYWRRSEVEAWLSRRAPASRAPAN